MGESFHNYHIAERSFVSYIKREIHQGNLKRNFSERQIGEIDIIVSEMTSNLIKYVGSGDLLYRAYNIGDQDSVFEVLCIDKGEGIVDLIKMRKDGFSSSTTLGQGLGAIERLSTYSQLYSQLGWGTILYSKVSTPGLNKPGHANGIDISSRGLVVNKPRESVCGDGYCIQDTKTHYRVLFADGLGHGPAAKKATDQAIEYFLASEENDPVELLRKIHGSVRHTRGLVGTIAICDRKAEEWVICGVGNILTRIYGGIHHKNYMPYNGTLGLNIPNSMNRSVYPVEKNQHLIMCSDGINSRWDLNRFPGAFRYDNMILASCIYKDYVRGTDDASVLIIKVT